MEIRGLDLQKSVEVNLSYPLQALRSLKERKGKLATRHLNHQEDVLYYEHGRACKGCQGGWKVGRKRFLTKLRGPTGSQIGHSSRRVGKPHTGRSCDPFPRNGACARDEGHGPMRSLITWVP